NHLRLSTSAGSSLARCGDPGPGGDVTARESADAAKRQPAEHQRERSSRNVTAAHQPITNSGFERGGGRARLAGDGAASTGRHLVFDLHRARSAIPAVWAG